MIIQLNNISLNRGNTILDNVDWSFYQDENWVILGSNGSGKTSIINVVMGYEPPTKGKFIVLGQPYGHCPWDEVRRQIGVVSHTISQKIRDDQNAQSVVLSGKSAMINYWGTPSADEMREADQWLYVVGSEDLKNRKWGILSQGEKQRVLIARALINRPKLLILDEPCAGLDPIARENFLDFLHYTLTEEFKIPTVLITHHVEEILNMFTHVLLIREGKIIAAGPKENVMNAENLSTTYGERVTLFNELLRYRLDLARD